MICEGVSVAGATDTKRPAQHGGTVRVCWFYPTWLVHHQGLEPGTP